MRFTNNINKQCAKRGTFDHWPFVPKSYECWQWNYQKESYKLPEDIYFPFIDFSKMEFRMSSLNAGNKRSNWMHWMGLEKGNKIEINLIHTCYIHKPFHSFNADSRLKCFEVILINFPDPPFSPTFMLISHSQNQFETFKKKTSNQIYKLADDYWNG